MKNFEEINRALGAKKKLMTIASCALLLLATGCKKDEPKPQPEPAPSFVSDKERPTWAAPEDYDYTSSMTAVIAVDLITPYPEQAADFIVEEQDLIAAFIGDECLGVASPDDNYFYLYIASPSSNSAAVTLRYYSAHYKNLFEAKDAFPYSNDSHLGSVAAPFVPNLEVVTD